MGCTLSGSWRSAGNRLVGFAAMKSQTTCTMLPPVRAQASHSSGFRCMSAVQNRSSRAGSRRWTVKLLPRLMAAYTRVSGCSGVPSGRTRSRHVWNTACCTSSWPRLSSSKKTMQGSSQACFSSAGGANLVVPSLMTGMPITSPGVRWPSR